MRRRYSDELNQLHKTYQLAAIVEVGLLRDTLRVPTPMVFVGSGGALAVARLAADLHIESTGALSVALTPLEATGSRLSPGTGFVLFTASGKHPDALLAIAAARSRGACPMAVVTCRDVKELPGAIVETPIRVVSLPNVKDGFLATNSVLAMATALCQAYGSHLPASLPMLSRTDFSDVRAQCVLLTGPRYSAVASDLEARLSEIGLAAVQQTDYRNFAHGRHVGFGRNIDSTTVVAFKAPEVRALAERTLSLLPSDTHVAELMTDLAWPVGCLDLLVASMRLTGAVAAIRNIDPGRPSVAMFGRRLYNLPLKRLVPVPKLDPVERKLVAAGLRRQSQPAFESAFATWLEKITAVEFGGVVLDYDGTCCSTEERFDPPPQRVQEEIVRLASAGLVVGFATGRGRSLHEATRQWLPQELWPSVLVGIYNGSVTMGLTDEPAEYTSPATSLAAAADRITNLELGVELVIEVRQTQLSVHAKRGELSPSALAPLLTAVLHRSPELDHKVFASGHSVDILLKEVGKRAVIDKVEAAVRGEVLTVGDSGQAGGNDFELLAATRWSLSVDRCSGDPTRCWNLDTQGRSGPTLLAQYLAALQLSDGVARFRWMRR